MADKQMDIFDILGTHLDNAALLRSRTRKFDALMRHFAERGIPLAVVGDSKHLNRAQSTLKKHARRLGLRFPDYVARPPRFYRGHDSDCATHNMPALLNGLCDCSLSEEDE